MAEQNIDSYPRSSSSSSSRPLRSCKALSSVAVLFLAFFLVQQHSTQMLMMRFFRDVSRAKSRRRLLGSGTSLIAVLRGQEDDLPASYLQEYETSAETMTHEELLYFDGSEPGRPIYIAIMGRVFDVSNSPHFYSPGKRYHPYVAKDATRGFATGCFAPECLVSSLEGLGEAQLKEAQRWLELYTIHDQYRFIALLAKEDPIHTAIQQAELEEKMLRSDNGEPLSPGVLKEKGLARYREGDYTNARTYWFACLERLVDLTPLFLSSASSRIESEKERVGLHNLLGALAQKEGRLDDAVAHYEEARQILEDVLKPEERERDLSYSTLLADEAAAYFHMKNLEKAVPLLQRAVSIMEIDLDGKKLPLLCNSLFNLALATNELGDRAGARAILLKIDATAESIMRSDLSEETVRMMETLLERVYTGLEQLQDLDGDDKNN